MTTTLEAANEAMRRAVETRLATGSYDEFVEITDGTAVVVQQPRTFYGHDGEVIERCVGYKVDEGDPDPCGDCDNCNWQRGDSLLKDGKPSGSPEWLNAANELIALHYEKTAQYGDEDPFANVTASAKCGVEPWRRALCDLSDCVVRMQRYANGQPVDYENALMDAANWALICLVKLREKKA